MLSIGHFPHFLDEDTGQILFRNLSEQTSFLEQDALAPADYVTCCEVVLKRVLAAAKRARKGFRADQVVGIGVDTTGSTPIPVDSEGVPLAMKAPFKKESKTPQEKHASQSR